nr:POU domain, class 2, transcription factor 2 like [Ipomoea batatas]
MKASIKFREDQKPLLRAKVPISILSFPFQSGIAAGESKELALSLGTFFDAGPSVRFSYRPNDSQKPFSFVVKTGLGNYGAPNSSPFTMSAEFNLIGNQNPSFFVHFKPRFGDFCVKKSHSSSAIAKSFSAGSKLNDAVLDDEVLVAPVEKAPGYFGANVNFLDRNFRSLTPESPVPVSIENLFSGMTVSARTALPLQSRAVVNFRWGLRFPAPAGESDAVIIGKTDRTAGISFRNLPLLVMNKIGIEHLPNNDSKRSKPADVTEACLNVQKQLELIQAENGLLRTTLNDLRAEISAGSFSFKESDWNGSKIYAGGRVDRRSNAEKKPSDLNGFNGKPSEDVNEELKKALKASTGA